MYLAGDGPMKLSSDKLLAPFFSPKDVSMARNLFPPVEDGPERW